MTCPIEVLLSECLFIGGVERLGNCNWSHGGKVAILTQEANVG